MVKRKTRHKTKKLPVLHLSAPKGMKIKVKRTKHNPVVLQVGGQKKKYRVAVGRIEKWEDV